MSNDWASIGAQTRTPATSATNNSKASLGQQEFLTLLTAQLNNQDPLNPLDNAAFVAQLAQFSTVSGITEMNQSLSAIASRAGSDARSAAPQWVGRQVTDQIGVASTVTSVAFANDGSLILNLDSGRSIGIGAVASVA